MKKNRFSHPLAWLCFALLAMPLSSIGQDERELRPVSRTYVLTHVNVIQGPGRKLDWATVLIKDGLIKAVGKNVTVPADAIEIKADSMYVYAGFIDGLSHTGVTKPKDESKEKVKDPGNPPNDRAGITPEADVRNFLNPSDKSIEELRAIGFTTSQVVPYGRMLPGSGAVILLGNVQPDRMVLVPQSALYSEFTGADRIYPNTVIAIIAKWRELYKQAELNKNYANVYAANRANLERPSANRTLEAFYPVIDRKEPVLFNTAKILEAYRAIGLQKDLGFQLILGDLKEGWDIIPKIKSSGAKVFLSLDLPEEKKDDKKEDKKPETKPGEKKEEAAAKEEPKKEDAKPDPEKDALDKRKNEFIAKYTGQAAAFQQQNVVFGFSAMTVKAKDIPANLRRMMKAGLTEDQALAALTTNPAQLLGLSDRLGTIDNGKIANLVVSDKPYFNEKAKVRYVFVDGVLYKIDAADKPKGDANAKVDIAGSWTVSMETPQGKSEEKVIFKKDGSNYSGNISGGRLQQPVDLESVEVDGNNLKYKYTVQFGGQSLKVEVVAVLEGDSFKGSATAGQYGSCPVEGKKEPNR
jgi:hypothetical protein